MKSKLRTCIKCQSKFNNTIYINGHRKNLNKRKYCFTCSPFGKRNTHQLEIYDNRPFYVKNILYKKCTRCHNILPCDIEYFVHRTKNSFSSWCKSCSVSVRSNKKRKLKEKMVNYKGGKCQKCGYDKCLAALSFHHRNPKEKSFPLSRIPISDWNIIILELDKCDLLCGNCHNELHWNL